MFMEGNVDDSGFTAKLPVRGSPAPMQDEASGETEKGRSMFGETVHVQDRQGLTVSFFIQGVQSALFLSCTIPV